MVNIGDFIDNNMMNFGEYSGKVKRLGVLVKSKLEFGWFIMIWKVWVFCYLFILLFLVFYDFKIFLLDL